MRCLIVDSQKSARDELRRLLTGHAGVEVIGEADDLESAAKLAARQQPDVIFLDPALCSATEGNFATSSGAVAPAIVATAPDDRHARKAFEMNALDYLVRPLVPERLMETLNRIRRQSPHFRSGLEDAILVKTRSTARIIHWKSIQYIESKGNYTRVHFNDRPADLVLRTLKEWMSLAPGGFFLQTHRTILIRKNTIGEVRFLGEKRIVRLCDGSEVPVGRAFWAGVKAALGMEAASRGLRGKTAFSDTPDV